jgi:hypothetical protein
MAQVVFTPTGGGMKSVKSFFGINQHKPIPGSKSNFKDSVSQLFARLGVMPKLGTSISILDRAKNFLSKFNLGRDQAKDKTSEPGKNLLSGHIKLSFKAKPKEDVESLLFNSGSSSKEKKGSLKNTGSLIPSQYEEK